MKLRIFFSFCVVGAVGFAVDSGILWILTTFADQSPLIARLISFFCAVTVTWLLNSYITFKSTHYSFPAWMRYLSANGAGFLLNYSIYAILNSIFVFSPLYAVSIASAVALIFNYIVNMRLVFNRQ